LRDRVGKAVRLRERRDQKEETATKE
jgi:hypothetical protein